LVIAPLCTCPPLLCTAVDVLVEHRYAASARHQEKPTRQCHALATSWRPVPRSFGFLG
jgi:hypothetical protein